MFSLRLLWACWRVSVLKRRGLAADESVMAVVSRLSQRMRIARPVRVINSFLADGPSVAGWIRPLGWEFAYLNITQGIDLDNVPWFVPVKEGMRRDASSQAARALENIAKQMAAAREAAQSDEARGIPTWKLTVVNVTGLSDSRRKDLLSRLPLHESYPVSHERKDAAGLAIRDFDATLRYSFLTAWDGHPELQIAARQEN
jgi:hypothetical protein